jgi:predicted permease
MNSLIQDIRYSFRMWRKAPGFTAITVLVLALGIGGTSAMFTLINAVALRPLPVKSPDQLVRVYSKENKPGVVYHDFSYPNYADMREHNALFSDLLAFEITMVGLEEGDLTRRTLAMSVSANYFSVFGVRLAAGRPFTAEEERPGSGIPVAIVSYPYWQKTGANPALLGKTIRINSRPFQVVGIAPEFFTGTTPMFSPDFWLPLGMHEALAYEDHSRLDDRQHECLWLVGRLKGGLDLAQAQTQVSGLTRELAEIDPEAGQDRTLELGKLTRTIMSTSPSSGGDLSAPSFLLMAMAGAVLVIACLNLANMFLARSASRRKEFAIRWALGGGRGRLIRQLLTESFLLAVFGGLGGLLLASWSVSFLAASFAAKLGMFNLVLDPRPDWRILIVTFGACVLSVLVFGLGPAWKLSAGGVAGDLKETVGEALHGHGRRWLVSLRNLLVVGQLALSLALLTAAGVVAHSAFNAMRANPGFSLEKSVLIETDASLAGFDHDRSRQVYLDLLERLRSLPGVQTASFASVVPFGLFTDDREVRRADAPGDAGTGKDAPGSGKAQHANFNIVGNDYFKTLGIPLLQGRDFDRLEVSSDSAGQVAIIDEPLAKKLFPSENPLGKQIKTPAKPEPLEIVGVVAGVLNNLNDKTPQPHVYIPLGGDYTAGLNFHLRLAASGPAAESTMLKEAQRTIRSAAPQLAVMSVQTLRHFQEEGPTVWLTKTGARLFGVFGGLALLLAVVGVYGVNSFMVARRTREIGIRMALGAGTREVLWMILRQGLALTGIGLGLGFLLALTVAFLLRSVLYDVTTLDPFAFTIAPACLVAAALLACYVPARRAARINPLEALRCE